MSFPRYLRSRQYAEVRYTGGDIIAETANSWAPLAVEAGLTADAMDLVLNEVQLGDVLMLGANGAWAAGPYGSNDLGALDLATIVAGTPVSYVGTRTATPSAGTGIAGWQAAATAVTATPDYAEIPSTFGAAVPYPIVTGDLYDDWTVRFRPNVKVGGDGRILHASADNPLIFWVLNLGPAQGG